MARRRPPARQTDDDGYLPAHLRRFYPPKGARLDSYDSFDETYWPAMQAWRAERDEWFAAHGCATQADRIAALGPPRPS